MSTGFGECISVPDLHGVAARVARSRVANHEADAAVAVNRLAVLRLNDVNLFVVSEPEINFVTRESRETA